MPMSVLTYQITRTDLYGLTTVKKGERGLGSIRRGHLKTLKWQNK